MLENIPFQEFGVAISALIIMSGLTLWVVRAFLKYLREKNGQFTRLIENHLKTEVEMKAKLVASHKEQRKSNENLARSIEKLTDKL